MQEIWDENSSEWGGVWLTLINLPGYESGIEDLTDGVSLPVLQDTDDTEVAESYGASKWYVYLIDRSGHPRYVHYSLDLDGDEADRLVSEINELVKEAK